MRSNNTRSLFLRDIWVRFPLVKIAAGLICVWGVCVPPTVLAETTVPSTLDLSPPAASIQISFPAGQDSLDPFARQNLDQLVRDANQRSEIDSVQVISWGDSNNTTNSSPSTNEMELAARRARSVENYIVGRGNVMSVKSYNVARQPTALQDLLSSSDTNLAVSLRRAGISTSQDSRPGTVLVMVVPRN